jgi:hypothetical protein
MAMPKSGRLRMDRKDSNSALGVAALGYILLAAVTSPTAIDWLNISAFAPGIHIDPNASFHNHRV